VKAATFEAVVQSSITTCDGQTLCLEEVNVDGEVFIGLGTGCEERLRWTNNKYLTLTDEEHYNTAQNGTVPAETQKWVITSKSGCLKQLNDFYPPIAQEYADGHRLAVDPACQTGFDSEFWAISSPFHVNDTVDAATGSPFTIVESHVNRTRRLAYYVNATKPYTTEDGKNCTCVDPLDDPLGTLMVTQAHVHETRPDKTESYWYGRDACDGHVLRVVIFPPSPPPPSPDDRDPPPSPPYVLHESLVVGGAALSTGGFFFLFCGCCAVMGMTTAVRGRGSNKWWGTQEMLIHRDASEPEHGRAQFAATGVAPQGAGFFASMPLEKHAKRDDPSRVSLLKF